jgi:hypothetical protein
MTCQLVFRLTNGDSELSPNPENAAMAMLGSPHASGGISVGVGADR